MGTTIKQHSTMASILARRAGAAYAVLPRSSSRLAPTTPAVRCLSSLSGAAGPSTTTALTPYQEQKRALSSRRADRIDTDRETIVRLLYSIASKKEVERYLRIFSTANKFAVLKVGGAFPLALLLEPCRPLPNRPARDGPPIERAAGER